MFQQTDACRFVERYKNVDIAFFSGLAAGIRTEQPSFHNGLPGKVVADGVEV